MPFFITYIPTFFSLLILLALNPVVSFLIFVFFVCLFVWPWLMACGILVPWPGIEPASAAVEAQTLNHWTARKVPSFFIMFRLQQRLSYSFLLRAFFSQFLYPTLSWRSSCHSACSFSALPLAPLPLLTWPVLVCPRALAIVFLQVISSYPMGFISHLYAVYTPAYITSRFPVPDRPKTELWLPPLPAPNLFLP